MDMQNVVRVVVVLCFLLVAAAAAVHSPGQVSMDTSIQLYEASTGQSISWNPPFMSTLLRWLGGGELATAGMVFLNTVLIYGALAITAGSVAAARIEQGMPRIAAWRGMLAWVLVLNPIVLIYVGIVWKDVLFASLLTAGCALGIAATLGTPLRRWACAALSVVLLAAAFLVRQQGVFMAPVLVLVPIIALSPYSRTVRPRLALLTLACFVIVVLGLQAWVAESIRSSDGRSSSVGFRSIMIFDMAGIVSRSPRSFDEFAYSITAEQLASVRASYDPSRIDYLARDPQAIGWLGAKSNEALFEAWWALLKQNPEAYIAHRSTAYSTLLGLRGIEPTLPVHIGVDGNETYLAAVGLPVGRDARDLFVYRVASSFFSWPLYHHAFWLTMLVGAAAAVARAHLPGRLRAISAVIILATTLLYLSFLPTMISSDFRYLFGAIPLVTILWLLLLLGASRQAFSPNTTSSLN